MGWTERSEIKSDFEDIVNYIVEMESFHDRRIGFIEYDGVNARITIEEVVPDKRLAKSAGLIWDFNFKGVSEFLINTDCQLRFYISEVERGKKECELKFNLDQGYIDIAAESISLGVPSAE